MIFSRFALGISTLLCSITVHAGCREQLIKGLPDGGVIIFGELHGTREIPKVFFDCVSDFVLSHESVEVFLELDASENDSLRRYANGKINEIEFLKSPHWKKMDGRASIAMLTLVRALNDLPGGPVVVRGFDSSAPDRERAMMQNLDLLRSGKRYSLVLTGNVHARLTRGVAWNADFVPFAKHLLDKGEHVISLNAHYTAGNTWMCSPACGVTPLQVPPQKGTGTDVSGVVLGSGDPAYTGYFSVGPVTASAPARAQ